MGYDDKSGNTVIINGDFESLGIIYEGDKPNHYPVLFHTPDVTKFGHIFIEITPSQAKTLHSWLENYIKDTSTKEDKL